MQENAKLQRQLLFIRTGLWYQNAVAKVSFRTVLSNFFFSNYIDLASFFFVSLS